MNTRAAIAIAILIAVFTFMYVGADKSGAKEGIVNNTSSMTTNALAWFDFGSDNEEKAEIKDTKNGNHILEVATNGS